MPTPFRPMGWVCVALVLTGCAPDMTPEQEAVACEVCFHAGEVDSTAEAQARGEAYSVLVATAMAAIGVEGEGPGDLHPDLYEIFEEEDFTGSYDAVPRILDWCRDNELPTTGD
ncbi:hypothetical protein [Nocardiopsis sp. CNS-639]|uniref:hypothetical protein n=1 Tax=Nocardiopsis sp. CNS-639 TaxID=1169153 RepID=UPI0012DFC9C9|nr:hypothetical protein [Nocardiopsis sp. CNS-639]